MRRGGGSTRADWPGRGVSENQPAEDCTRGLQKGKVIYNTLLGLKQYYKIISEIDEQKDKYSFTDHKN